eukprot:COSAG06_NODE_6031_length_3145_cov_26.486868_5_plen_51_part_00
MGKTPNKSGVFFAGMLAFDAVLYIAILLYADYAEEKASKAKSAGERRNTR